MPRYQAPVEDWQFLLHDVLRVERYADLPGFADLSPEFTSSLLDAAARFHVDVLHPLNAPGDAEGASILDGAVATPHGFRQAWNAYRLAGWHILSLEEALGGAGLPPLMSVPISELRVATGHSFSMYSSFCAPTARMLSMLGEPWMREHVVPRLADGEWTATMCMTEPQAGTDLRQLATRAEPLPDGTWRLTGHKIFISGGEHDLTDNIIHVVLAKVVDEAGRVPAGLGSVSVFMVPKRLVDPTTGSLLELNHVRARSIEHKMGIEGSATCALDFEGATGWRLSDAGRTGSAAAMAPMFLLMNYARVGTAMSGIGYAEIAYQNAAEYARERLAGRATGAPVDPARIADPIIAHADIRRLLLETRAFTEGARAGAMYAALQQSIAEHGSDAGDRERAFDVLEVLVPVMKAFFTDRGFDATVACQQVLGGHGYVKDHGLEQFVRNARIGQLYEGANGIQAVDLLHRKLTAHGGRAQRHFLLAIDALLARLADQAGMRTYLEPLAAARTRLGHTLDWLRDERASAPGALDAGAYDLLTVFGIVFVGWMWVEVVAVVLNPSPSCVLGEAQRRRKCHLAQIWMHRQMPLVDALCCRIESGNASLFALADSEI